MINEWNFPHNGYGQVRGISDAGIETFTGTPLLVRTGLWKEIYTLVLTVSTTM